VRSNWSPELEDLVRRADPIAEVILHALIVEDEDMRANKAGWEQADSTTGFDPMKNGAIRIAGSIVPLIQNISERTRARTATSRI
jgi:hypothetical protein